MVRLRGAVVRARSVDRFFQLSLLGLLTSGYLALVGSGRLELPTIVFTSSILAVRLLMILGAMSFRVRDSWVTAVTLCYITFYPLDYWFISGEFLPATVHLVLFLALVKILTAKTDRDHFQVILIAFIELLIASVLSSNLSFFLFLILFLVMAVAALASWEIRRSIRAPGKVARGGQRMGRRLSVLSLYVAGGVLVITAGLFFILPRTARAAFEHLAPERYHLTGFSDQVRLGEIGEIKQQSTVLMHVRVAGVDGPLYLKWRGNALATFDGRKWFNPAERGVALPVVRRQVIVADDHQRRRSGRRINYEVQLEAFASNLLFIAGTAEVLRIDARLVMQTPTNGYRVGYRPGRVLRYGVYSFLEQYWSGKPFPEPGLSPEERRTYLELPEVDPRVRELAERLTVSSRDIGEKARILERNLSTAYAYTLELPEHEVEDPIADFLFNRREGHCEYFASAMAVMLRTLGVPSRVATGFQGGIYNPISGWQLIRASDAHSWVEAWVPGQGWVSFDPTPTDPAAGALGFWTRISLLADAAEVFWQDWILSYDLDRQHSLVARVDESRRVLSVSWFSDLGNSLEEFAAESKAWLRDNGLPAVVVLLSLAMLILLAPKLSRWFRGRRRALRLERGEVQASDATILYERALRILKRRGIEKPGWMTPLEFAAVIPAGEVATVVAELALSYNHLRFGGRTDAAARMVFLLDELEAVSGR